MAPFEALHKCKCRHLAVAKDRKKSYANCKRKPLEFLKCNKVLFKVYPSRGIKLFNSKEKLIPCFMGPCESTYKIILVAHVLALPFDL